MIFFCNRIQQKKQSTATFEPLKTQKTPHKKNKIVAITNYFASDTIMTPQLKLTFFTL